ncbi:MAG: hypothetical protein M1300_05705 [Epsilonproteobacteria bacterium]|nr:hypothetical protein [Campylobacterota bacterium]
MKKFVSILLGVVVVCSVAGYGIGNIYSKTLHSDGDWSLMMESGVQERSLALSNLQEENSFRTKLLLSMKNNGFEVIDSNSDQDIKFAQDVAKGLVGEKTSAPHTVQALKNYFAKHGFAIVKK